MKEPLGFSRWPHSRSLPQLALALREDVGGHRRVASGRQGAHQPPIAPFP